MYLNKKNLSRNIKPMCWEYTIKIICEYIISVILHTLLHVATDAVPDLYTSLTLRWSNFYHHWTELLPSAIGYKNRKPRPELTPLVEPKLMCGASRESQTNCLSYFSHKSMVICQIYSGVIHFQLFLAVQNSLFCCLIGLLQIGVSYHHGNVLS